MKKRKSRTAPEVKPCADDVEHLIALLQRYATAYDFLYWVKESDSGRIKLENSFTGCMRDDDDLKNLRTAAIVYACTYEEERDLLEAVLAFTPRPRH